MGLGEDTTTFSRRKKKKVQHSSSPKLSDSSFSEIRFTTGELEMAFGKTMLKRQLFDVVKDRDELKAEDAQLQAENVRLGEEVSNMVTIMRA
ncbi:unnamed protein product [Ilex paraguariensis]|uniref:Uncharacterized protein n=1 Tax=Ilex paraguariensis TaxID=185542 RepID=A0ABC8UJ80_9AQUA